MFVCMCVYVCVYVYVEEETYSLITSRVGQFYDTFQYWNTFSSSFYEEICIWKKSIE